MSKAPQLRPSRSWTAADVAGTVWSGDVVARISRPMSAGASPARSRACCDASMARSLVMPPTYRCRIPLRSTIQLSDVSSVCSRS